MAKFSIKTYKDCANPSCNNIIEIRIINDATHSDFGLPVIAHRKKKTCSIQCQTAWQKTRSWEASFGSEKAILRKEQLSARISSNNPSTNPETAKKISTSLKKYIEKNPETRIGENNPFYGRKHSPETIQHWKETKTGKLAYNEFQREKQLQNTPKKENHPLWLGGISNGEYGFEFNAELKQLIKETYRFTCQICKFEIPTLDIHHIDYNKKNNIIDNLIPLCKKCHGKTNYDRDTWKKILTEFIKSSKINDK